MIKMHIDLIAVLKILGVRHFCGQNEHIRVNILMRFFCGGMKGLAEVGYNLEINFILINNNNY